MLSLQYLHPHTTAPKRTELHHSYITVTTLAYQYAPLPLSTPQTYLQVPVCGDDEMCRGLVCGIVRDLRLTPLDYGRLTNAKQIEEIPLRFFSEWSGAFLTSIVVWTCLFLLLVLQ